MDEICDKIVGYQIQVIYDLMFQPKKWNGQAAIEQKLAE